MRHSPPYESLLERHMPQLRYDSNEQFFADAAESALAAGFAELRRAREGEDELLAPAEGLRLDALGEVYGDGRPAEDHDYLSYLNTDYRALSQFMHADRELRNVVYGRGVESETDGRLWLQYWLYYFFNDYSMAGGFGLHEGDWELVQLQMNEDHDGGPESAIYAQHKHAERRAWADVETVDRDGVRPVAYVASGSHASYFEQGLHKAGAIWWDVSDGERGSPPDTRLVTLDDRSLPGWIEWPGIWGGTRGRWALGRLGVEQPSPPGPRGPERKRRPHWDDPARIDFKDHEVRSIPAGPPVDVSRAAGRVVVEYDVGRLAGTKDAPERMIVTVNKQQPAGEVPRTPPRTYTYAIEHTRTGRLEIEAWLDPDRDYDVSVRLLTSAGMPSGACRELLKRPPEARPGVSRWNRFTSGIGRLVARVRGRPG